MEHRFSPGFFWWVGGKFSAVLSLVHCVSGRCIWRASGSQASSQASRQDPIRFTHSRLTTTTTHVEQCRSRGSF
uniref:Putative secreted protein n=1 Tax=Anopheles marajoara TaxID=58244 RepID=A0A2M4CDG7_9DIPT